MDFDIRWPIGLLFLAIGVMLAGYGLVADPREFAGHSLGLNVDLWWGSAMALGGAVFLALAFASRRAGRGPGT